MKVLVVVRHLKGHAPVVSSVNLLAQDATVKDTMILFETEKRRIVTEFVEFRDAAWSYCVSDVKGL